jgi:hypothetical protein
MLYIFLEVLIIKVSFKTFLIEFYMDMMDIKESTAPSNRTSYHVIRMRHACMFHGRILIFFRHAVEEG